MAMKTSTKTPAAAPTRAALESDVAPRANTRTAGAPRLKLTPLFQYSVNLKRFAIGPTPSGDRQVFGIEGGDFRFLDGSELAGKVLPLGGDWALDGPDAITRLDIRAVLEPYPVDGSPPFIFVQATGVLILPPSLRQQLQSDQSAQLQWEDAVCLSSIRLEARAPGLERSLGEAKIEGFRELFPHDSLARSPAKASASPSAAGAGTGDWSWLNHVVAVGQGRLRYLGVDWVVYSVVGDEPA
jgi:hypothetical protein